jgi:hypothetical protein
MMDEQTRRRMVAKIRASQTTVTELANEIEAILPYDIRAHRREAQTRADLLFGKLEDLLWLTEEELADAHQQATSAVRERSTQLLETIVAFERDERDARRSIELLAHEAKQIEHEGKQIKAAHRAGEVAAERALVGKLFGGPA